MFGQDANIPCSWCGSKDTYFKEYRAWEEDERGNPIYFSDLASDYSPKDELWYCNNCEDHFTIELQEDQH